MKTWNGLWSPHQIDREPGGTVHKYTSVAGETLNQI